MVTRTQIIAEARTWLGTPYQHQARCKGVGADCAGVVLGVARALQLSSFNTTAYGRYPLGDKLRQLLHEHAVPVEGDAPWLPAQIALMRFDSEPQHLGILSGTPQNLYLIHAYSNIGSACEHRLADVWRSRVIERFEFPQLVEEAL